MSLRDLVDKLPPERRLSVDSRWKLKNGVMAVINAEVTAQQPLRRPRRRRFMLVAASFLMVVASVGTAWALTRPAPELSTRILCSDNADFDAGSGTVIAAVSGDPVADCAAELERMGISHGTLAVYVNELGGVVVVVEDIDVPPEWVPLGNGFTQDTSIIALEEALTDVDTGLAARCYSSSEAVPFVEQVFNTLDLNWTVIVKAGRVADGETGCAYPTLTERANDQVILVAVEPGAVGNTRP